MTWIALVLEYTPPHAPSQCPSPNSHPSDLALSVESPYTGCVLKAMRKQTAEPQGKEDKAIESLFGEQFPWIKNTSLRCDVNEQ